MTFCFRIQNFAEIGQSVDELWPKKRFSRWRPPPPWIWKNSIFGHVTATGFNIWCSVPNLIKIGQFFTEIWRFNDFQNGGRPTSWILKTCSFSLSSSPCRHAVLLPHTKLRWNRTIAAILNLKKVFGHVTVIGFNICCSVPNLIKIGWFLLRYGDLAIFKMAAVRYVGFVMTSQYCIAGHIFVVQILFWNFLSIGVVVSDILAIS